MDHAQCDAAAAFANWRERLPRTGWGHRSGVYWARTPIQGALGLIACWWRACSRRQGYSGRAARARGQVYVNGGLLHAREPRPGDGTGKRGRHGWRSRCTLSCWLRRPSPGQQHAHMGRFLLAWGRAGCRGCSRGKYSTCVTCGCTVSCTARCYSPRARGRAGSARGSRLAGSARAG